MSKGVVGFKRPALRRVHGDCSQHTQAEEPLAFENYALPLVAQPCLWTSATFHRVLLRRQTGPMCTSFIHQSSASDREGSGEQLRAVVFSVTC